jgi:hypothetical protein
MLKITTKYLKVVLYSKTKILKPLGDKNIKFFLSSTKNLTEKKNHKRPLLLIWFIFGTSRKGNNKNNKTTHSQ